MPFARRRPLLRAAAVGGVAAMGARAETNRALQDAPPASADPPPAPPEPPSAATAAAADASDRVALLKQLAQLHDTGALTDEEFAAEKAKILS